MTYAALPKLKKNSISTTLSSGINSTVTTIPVTELAVFYDVDGVLITEGISIGFDSDTESYTEEITITGASATSGAGNLTGATRGVNVDGTNGAGRAWDTNTKIAVMFTTGIYNKIRSAIVAGMEIPIGVEWTTNATSPTLVLTNQYGTPITLTTLDWDRHPVFGAIRRCNLADDGTVNAYYGDPTFSYTGSNGQVMVEIPKFWYRTDALTNKYRFTISPIARTGYTVHPAFVVDSVEKDHIYVSAFEGSVYDVTTPAAACVNTIQVTAEPTSSGNLTITLDGNYVFTVAVLDADTIEGVVDKIVAAGA
ncbi:MAG: hypothetical protein WC554_11650, partial [Clostridia bacterium]